MWMDLENVVISEISQRKTNTVRYHFYVESKKQYKWMYTQNRNGLTDIETKLVVTKGGRERQGKLRDTNYYI